MDQSPPAPSPLTALDAVLAGLRAAPLMQRAAIAERAVYAARAVLADQDGRLADLADRVAVLEAAHQGPRR